MTALTTNLVSPMRRTLLLIGCLGAGCGNPVRYDVVINGGRVIDPETRLDGVRNIGIIGDRIARISGQIRAARQVPSML